MVAEDSRVNGEFVRRSKKWRRLRQAVQLLALLLFLYLLLGTLQDSTTFLPHDLFFRLDPLAGISAMLSGRSWMAPMLLGGFTILLTLVLGLAWCGWLCPLGTVLDWTPARRPSQNKLANPSSRWRQTKYFLLFTVLVAAVFGSLTLIIFDPITLLFRTVTSVLLPGISFLITKAETWLYNIEPFQPAVAWFDNLARGSLLTEQPFFLPSVLIAIFFIVVLSLNAIRSRFWCRYICPLGALLGLISKVALVRYRVDEVKCTSCQRCAVVCPTGAVDAERGFTVKAAECNTCLECMEECPTEAITFGGQRSSPVLRQYDPERRRFIVSLGAAAVGAQFLWIAPALYQTQPLLVRPPGTSEKELLSKCIRCGECVKVCPTGVIQPSSSISRWEGLWTPRLVTRIGYCDYACTSCGQVCPTGAIAELPLGEKQQTVIGIAYIDKKRCIPWAEGRDCIVCEEMCPVPQKAIELEEQIVENYLGEKTLVHLPTVLEHLCIGCGICEYQCPVYGEAAIRIRLNGE